MKKNLCLLLSRRNYGSVLFFLVMVFVLMNFSVTRFLTRHYVIQNKLLKKDVRKLDDYSSWTLVLFIYG